MFSKHFLVRFTRLGLTMYSLFWCMSFTVCASDHPIADLAVMDSVSIAAQAQEPEGIQLPGDVDTLSVPTETEVTDEVIPDADTDADTALDAEADPEAEPVLVDDDEVLTEDESSDDASILDVEEPDNVQAIYFNVSSVTIIDYTEIYDLDVECSESGVINPERLEYNFLDEDEQPVASIWGVELKRESGSTKVTLDATKTQGGNKKFYIEADYINSEGATLTTTLPVVIRNVPTELDLNSDHSSEGTTYDPNVDAYTITKGEDYLSFDIFSVTPDTRHLDANKFTWTLTENGETVNPEERGLKFSCFGNISTIGTKSTDFNGTANLILTATYSNTFTDAAGNEVSYPDVSIPIKIFIDTRPFRDTIKAHFLSNEATVQLDSPTNTIPFEIRYIDTERGYPPEGSYSFRGSVYFSANDEVDREFLEYLDVTLDQDVPSINVKLKDNYLEDTAVIGKLLTQESITVTPWVRLDFPGQETGLDVPSEYITLYFKSGPPDNVNGIMLNTTSLTITDFTESYAINTITTDGEGTIDPSRLVYSLIDEVGDKVDSIPGVSLQPVTGTTECILDVSAVKENTKFFIDAAYKNSEGTAMNVSIPVLAQVLTEKVDFKVIPGGSASVDGKDIIINGIDGRLEFDLYSLEPEGVLLDEYQITWDLLENGKSVDETRGINFLTSADAALVSIYSSSSFNGTGTFEVVAVYDNSYTDAAGNEVKGKSVNATCTFTIDTRTIYDTIEAHFPDSSASVQIYNVTNTIPFVIRYTDDERGCPSYKGMYFDRNVELNGVTEADKEIISYLNVTLHPSNQTIRINLPKSVVSDNTIVNKIIKKKSIKASLTVGLRVKESDPYNYYTTENITISFAAAKPTVKAENALTFDSFRSPVENNLYQGRTVFFTGADVDYFEFVDPAAALKNGLIVDTNFNSINITEAAPTKTGKKTVKVIVHLDDSEYRLPADYTPVVPITYTIQDGAPTLAVSSTSFQLNSFAKESCRVNYNLTGDISKTNIAYKILDSKGKDISSAGNLTVNVQPYDGGDHGYISIKCNDNTVDGQTYKVSVYPEYKSWIFKNGKTGKAKTITVKTVAGKNKDNISVTSKTKGTIDASIYGSSMNITLTGKNTCQDYKLPDIKVYDSKMEEIDKSLFEFTPNLIGTGYIVNETTAFSLLKNGLGGQKVTVVFDYGEVLGKKLNATCSFKIAKSTVTPKLNVTTVNYNPDVPTGSINTSITNLPGDTYKYRVAMTCGKDNITLGYNTDCSGTNDIICIDTSALSRYAGKTISVKITPSVPSELGSITLPAKAATFTIKVLNPAKKKASVTGKVKGSIDAVRDTTNATITLTYKNIYAPESTFVGYEYRFFQQTKNANISCDDLFYVDDEYPLVIKRKPGQNVAAGTYKALVISKFKYIGEPLSLSTVVTFKVTRGGKTESAIKPEAGNFAGTTGKLINREYTRGLVYNATVKDENVNGISHISLGGNGKFDEIFTLEQSPYITWNFRLSMKSGYIEKNKGKAITKAVTKTVPIEIYYEGSDVPDKINIKVTILP